MSIIKDNENEIFFMKSSSKCRNFRNKVLKDSGKEREEILNSDKEVIDEEDIKKRGLELSNILQTNDECFEIKFWLLFKIVECPDD